MDVRPIRTEEQHALALEEIERLWGAPLGTPDGDKLDVLATLVDKYEDEHFSGPDTDPIDLLAYAISEMGRSQAELGELLGSRPRASEILNRRRHMTLDQIRTISEAWHLPITLLAKPYALSQQYA